VPTAHPGHWLGPLIKLGRLGPAQPIPVGLDLAPKKLKKWNRPAQLVLLRVCLAKTHPYTLAIIFMPILVDIWPNKPSFDIRKF